MANFLVGCDVGTSGTKAVVMDDEGRVLGSHYIEYPLITPRPGWAEQNPEWYWDAVANTIKASITQAKVDPKEIRGVSISALAPACILVDRQLRPLQLGHIWMDRRATKECRWLKEKIGDERVFKLSGNPIDPYYASAKLMWERNNRPELYGKTYKLQTAADYPTMRLTGKAVTDYSNASLIGIAFDIVNKTWDTALIEEIGLDPLKFPEPYPCDEVIGEVTREAAERSGLSPGTPVVAGTVDANAGWLSGGATDPGDASLVMGTAGCLGVIHDEPKFTRNMITIPHTVNSRSRYTTLAAIVSCGAVTRYFRDTFGQLEKLSASALGIDVYEMMNLEAATVPPGSDGLIVIPYFMGERTPIWDPLARGIIFGMSLAHGRGHLLRALMEGATYAIKHCFDLIRQSGIKITYPLILGEGGARSPLWRQIVSDVLNVPVVFMRESKGAPVGNALAAGVGVGVFKDYSPAKAWAKTTDSHQPDPERHERYLKYYQIFRKVYEDAKGNFELLADATGYS